MSELSNLLQEYDDLVGAVNSSSHGLYQNALARWFSLINETPAFARVCSHLEAMNDFDQWYSDLQNRQAGHGSGAAALNLPIGREAAIGTQLALFRRMSEGKIDAGCLRTATFRRANETSMRTQEH